MKYEFVINVDGNGMVRSRTGGHWRINESSTVWDSKLPTRVIIAAHYHAAENNNHNDEYA